MKRRGFAITTALLLLLTLTACGSKTETAAATATAPAASMDSVNTDSFSYGGDMYYEAEMAGGETGTSIISGQKLIRTASLEMETTEFETTNAAVEDLVAQMGGYMEQSNLRNTRSGYRYADYTIRIPAERFTEFLNQAGELCHETWRSVSQEDISEVYYDTQGRLNTQQIKLERLQELLKKADNMEDIITIESAISDTEAQIESLSGQLRRYDALVDYSTVNVHVNEVYKLSNVEEAPTTFWSRLSGAFADGWRSFTDGMEDLAVDLAYSWMWLVLLAVLVIAAAALVRKRLRKKRAALAKKADDKPEQT